MGMLESVFAVVLKSLLQFHFHRSASQLKQQDANNASRKKAIEELEKSINMAEATCPGITDKMVKKLLEKFQK